MLRSPLSLRIRSFFVLAALIGGMAAPSLGSARTIPTVLTTNVQSRLAKRQARNMQSELKSRVEQARLLRMRQRNAAVSSASSRSSSSRSSLSRPSSSSLSSAPVQSSSSQSSATNQRIAAPKIHTDQNIVTPDNPLAARVLELVNAERAKADLPALRFNTLLERSAEGHMRDMIQFNYFDHIDPDGDDPTARIKAEGYPGPSTCSCIRETYFGENIARGQRTPEEVMEDWMQSPGHRDNILNVHFVEIGITVEENVWVQNFGGVWER